MLAPPLTLSLLALSSAEGKVNKGFGVNYLPSKGIDPAALARGAPSSPERIDESEVPKSARIQVIMSGDNRHYQPR
jgi:hypothetical protein